MIKCWKAETNLYLLCFLAMSKSGGGCESLLHPEWYAAILPVGVRGLVLVYVSLTLGDVQCDIDGAQWNSGGLVTHRSENRNLSSTSGACLAVFPFGPFANAFTKTHAKLINV